MKTKRRDGAAASTPTPRAPDSRSGSPATGAQPWKDATPARPGRQPPAFHSRQPPPSGALRQVRVLNDELDILVGELRDPHGGLVGIRHRAPRPANSRGSAPLRHRRRRRRKWVSAARAASADTRAQRHLPPGGRRRSGPRFTPPAA